MVSGFGGNIVLGDVKQYVSEVAGAQKPEWSRLRRKWMRRKSRYSLRSFVLEGNGGMQGGMMG